MKGVTKQSSVYFLKMNAKAVPVEEDNYLETGTLFLDIIFKTAL